MASQMGRVAKLWERKKKRNGLLLDTHSKKKKSDAIKWQKRCRFIDNAINDNYPSLSKFGYKIPNRRKIVKC